MISSLMVALTPPIYKRDADARRYIAAVESADGQPLEASVRTAITTFIIGCKSDGIWDCINASCILSCARTLTGALVPLKGPTPTSFNFVSGDYSRTTGLVGNGTTKYLNSNRNNNADVATNHHISIYYTRLSTTNNEILMGYRPAGIDTGGKWTGLRIAASAAPLASSFASIPNADVNQSGAVVALNSTTFQGLSRTGTANYTSRAVGANVTQTSTSTTAASGSIFVFALNNGGTPSGFTTSRASFYSIGESVDLALLDSRVATLISNSAFAINTGLNPLNYDADTIAYVNAGYAAGGTLA
tara:strand:+ start:17500 stop:18405 length:906 start_codon:yes stop_codon:yes gene_type:complete